MGTASPHNGVQLELYEAIALPGHQKVVMCVHSCEAVASVNASPDCNELLIRSGGETRAILIGLDKGIKGKEL